MRLKFLERSLVFEGEKIFDHWLCLQVWDLKKLVQKHLEDHHSFSKVLIIVAPELSFFGDRGNWQAGMHLL